MLTPKTLQSLLISHGFKIGSAGADGIWGPSTERAVDQWFSTGIDLHASSPTPPIQGDDIIPESWMPVCVMRRIIVHWSAGGYEVSSVDKEHYHFIVDGAGNVVRGNNSILANVSTSDADGYAAHTQGCNTQSIGIAAACMLNAVESPFNAGKYPLREVQWEKLIAIAACLCRNYSIPVTPKTVLQHGEVQKNLGIAQKQKWDINKLPWAPGMTPDQVHNAFRVGVAALL